MQQFTATNMILGKLTVERELQKCILKIRPREDLEAVEWVPLTEDEVSSAQLFINDQLTIKNYALQKYSILRSVNSTYFSVVRIWGVTKEQLVQKREDGEQFIFLGLDRILSIEKPHYKH